MEARGELACAGASFQLGCVGRACSARGNNQLWRGGLTTNSRARRDAALSTHVPLGGRPPTVCRDDRSDTVTAAERPGSRSASAFRVHIVVWGEGRRLEGRFGLAARTWRPTNRAINIAGPPKSPVGSFTHFFRKVRRILFRSVYRYWGILLEYSSTRRLVHSAALLGFFRWRMSASENHWRNRSFRL